jgi:hypothetical protein
LLVWFLRASVALFNQPALELPLRLDFPLFSVVATQYAPLLRAPRESPRPAAAALFAPSTVRAPDVPRELRAVDAAPSTAPVVASPSAPKLRVTVPSVPSVASTASSASTALPIGLGPHGAAAALAESMPAAPVVPASAAVAPGTVVTAPKAPPAQPTTNATAATHTVPSGSRVAPTSVVLPAASGLLPVAATEAEWRQNLQKFIRKADP